MPGIEPTAFPRDYAREFIRKLDAPNIPFQYRNELWAPLEGFTPAWTTSGTAPVLGAGGSITGRFKRFGSVGFYRGVINVGGATTFGTGEWRVSLPTGWQVSTDLTNGDQDGLVIMRPNGSTKYTGFCFALPGEFVLRMQTNSLTPASVTNTAPVTWTANTANFLSWKIWLELVD